MLCVRVERDRETARLDSRRSAAGSCERTRAPWHINTVFAGRKDACVTTGQGYHNLWTDFIAYAAEAATGGVLRVGVRKVAEG